MGLKKEVEKTRSINRSYHRARAEAEVRHKAGGTYKLYKKNDKWLFDMQNFFFNFSFFPLVIDPKGNTFQAQVVICTTGLLEESYQTKVIVKLHQLLA